MYSISNQNRDALIVLLEDIIERLEGVDDSSNEVRRKARLLLKPLKKARQLPQYNWEEETITNQFIKKL